MYIYIYIHIYIFIHKFQYTYVWCVFIYIYMYVYKWMYIYIIYTHIHKHIYICTCTYWSISKMTIWIHDDFQHNWLNLTHGKRHLIDREKSWNGDWGQKIVKHLSVLSKMMEAQSKAIKSEQGENLIPLWECTYLLVSMLGQTQINEESKGVGGLWVKEKKW